MRKETITIDKCPHCNKKHKYGLLVDRTIIIKMFTMNDMYEQQRAVRVVRFFSCPTKNEMFQATVILYDTSSDRIKSVSDKTEINNDPDE